MARVAGVGGHREREAAQVHGDGGRGVFADAVGLIELKAVDALDFAGDGPKDFDVEDGGGIAEADFLAERGGTETASAGDFAMQGARAGGCEDNDAQAGAAGVAVGFHALELKLDPAIAVAGVGEKLVAVGVARDGAAHVRVDVLIAVVVDIAEGDGVPLLELAEAAGGGDVLEAAAAVVAEHAIGNEGGVIGVAGANIEIEPAVVIEIAEIAAHGVKDLVEADLFGDIGEGAVALVAEEAGAVAGVRDAEDVGSDVADILDAVAVDHEVEPAVVVVVPEPAGKTFERFGDTRLGGDIGETPGGAGRTDVDGGAVVAEEKVGAGFAGDVEIGAAVVVEIAGDDGFHKTDEGDAAGGRAFGERAVTIVSIQFAGVGLAFAGGGFVADEEVEMAVVVVVEPSGRLRGIEAEEAGFLGDVGEGAVAVVAEERVGIAAHVGEPGAAEDEDIDEAVVVVVGLDQVEPAGEAEEAGFGGALGEGGVAVVDEEPELAGGTPGGGEDVEEAVVVEVVENDAAGEFIDIDAEGGGDVGEAFDVVVGFEGLWWNEPAGGDFVGILAEGHVGDVEEPAGAEIAGEFFEERSELGDGGPGAGGELVDAAATNGEEAGVAVVVEEAVFLFADAEVGDGLEGLDAGEEVRGKVGGAFAEAGFVELVLCEGLAGGAGAEKGVAVGESELLALGGIGGGGERGGQDLGGFGGAVGIFVGHAVGGDFLEHRGHAARAFRLIRHGGAGDRGGIAELGIDGRRRERRDRGGEKDGSQQRASKTRRVGTGKGRCPENGGGHGGSVEGAAADGTERG